MSIKSRHLVLLATAFLTGCATSTVETRKVERNAAYSALPDESRGLVDQGQIKVGMSADAVYIAWGKPSQILSGETAKGATTTWLYHGAYLEEYRRWSYRYSHYGGRCYTEPFLDHDYYPRSYVKAEVIFENGLVKEWRRLPEPPTY
jgi:hypothetical protein